MRIQNPRFFGSAFLLVLFFLLSKTAIAEPQLKTFVRPADLKENLWQVDVYYKIDAAWLAHVSAADFLLASLTVTDLESQVVAQKVDSLKWLENTDGNASEIQRVSALQLRPGAYKIQWQVQDTRSEILFETHQDLVLASLHTRLALSDLIPVEFPKLNGPPFAELIWSDAELNSLGFHLYYEVHTANPDTVVKLASELANERGEILKRDRYTLYVFYGHRSDYLPVDLLNLSPGTYKVTLAVEGMPQALRTFEFAVRPEDTTLTELTDRNLVNN